MTKNKQAELQKELPYWEKEEPLSIRRGAFEIDYYDQSGMLNLRMTYVDKKNKIRTKPGVNIKKEYLQDNFKQLETLKTIFNKWYQEAKDLQEAEDA